MCTIWQCIRCSSMRRRCRIWISPRKRYTPYRGCTSRRNWGDSIRGRRNNYSSRRCSRGRCTSVSYLTSSQPGPFPIACNGHTSFSRNITASIIPLPLEQLHPPKFRSLSRSRAPPIISLRYHGRRLRSCPLDCCNECGGQEGTYRVSRHSVRYRRQIPSLNLLSTQKDPDSTKTRR